MPVSHHEGKQWTCDRLIELDPIHVVDIGPGEGIYSMLMRTELSDHCSWECVEVYEPYVEKFKLEDKYDVVHVRDVRDMPNWMYITDVIIFGDVIEHLERDEALRVLDTAKQFADNIVVSIPIVHMPQGAYQGNPYEAHLAHYTFEEMHAIMDGCEAFYGDVLGVFFWRRDADG